MSAMIKHDLQLRFPFARLIKPSVFDAALEPDSTLTQLDELSHIALLCPPNLKP
ncbi:MAG TPA: hypothetical protein VGI79_17200 [Caulobacteraceae bacterium]